MKRFTKVFLILGVCFLLAGTVVAGAAWGIGLQGESWNVSRERKEVTLNAGEISALEVSLTSEDLYVYPSGDGQIHIYYTEDENTEYVLDQNVGGGKQTASFYRKQKQAFLFFEFSFLEEDYDVTIEVPEEMTAELQLNMTSGKLKMEQLRLSELDINGTSGDLFLHNVTGEKVSAGTVSGGVFLENCEISGGIQASTTSGNIHLNQVSTREEPGALDVSTVSGEIHLEDCDVFGSFQAESTSGDVEADRTVIRGSIYITTVSGEVELELPRQLYQNAPRISTVSGAVCTDDFRYGTNSFTVSTTSGDVSIETIK